MKVRTDEHGNRVASIPSDPHRHKRQMRADGYPCRVCGRATEERFYVVEIGGGGTVVHLEDYSDEIYAGDPGFLGCQFVGPTCRKKFPEGFVGEWSD